MREFQKKAETRRLIYSIPSLILLFLVALLLLNGVIGVLGKEFASRKQARELEDKMALLRAREAELEVDIARLQTEEGIEKEIKEKFSVVQEGEHVAVLVDERKTASSTDDGEAWYKKIWAKFKIFH